MNSSPSLLSFHYPCLLMSYGIMENIHPSAFAKLNYTHFLSFPFWCLDSLSHRSVDLSLANCNTSAGGASSYYPLLRSFSFNVLSEAISKSLRSRWVGNKHMRCGFNSSLRLEGFDFLQALVNENQMPRCKYLVKRAFLLISGDHNIFLTMFFCCLSFIMLPQFLFSNSYTSNFACSPGVWMHGIDNFVDSDHRGLLPLLKPLLII